MKNQHPFLTSPGLIGELQLKNKMVMAAMGSNFASNDGKTTEQLEAYYEERARGGVGLIILETSAVSWPSGASMPFMLGFSQDTFIPGLQSLTGRIHQHGAKVAAQLNHSGKIAQEDTIAGRAIPVPSIPKSERSDMFGLLTQDEIMNFIKAGGPDGKGPRYHELTVSEIKNEIQHFVAAAIRAKKSNFDAIEIHAGHGYLISSFLSPAVNIRTDDYGGSVENRSRFLIEIISGIKNELGNFPIIVRLDANEFRIENGIKPEDFLATALLAQTAGADAIDVSAYGNISKGIAFTEAPLVHEPGGFLKFVKMAKAALSIPVIAVGRIEIDVAESGLKNNEFDFLAMGRKLLADPELPNKIISGHTHLIRPCIYCYVCVSQIFINKPLICAVNSQLGNEHRQDTLIHSTADQKRILVVGAGPSGMEAARLLAMKGHNVEIWEKDQDIGGTVRIAALAYEPNGHLITYLKHALYELGVKIKINTDATLQSIQDLKPDHVIVAIGATRDAPEIKGKNHKHVFDGEELRGLLFGSHPMAIKKLSPFQQLVLTIGRASQLLRNISALRLLSKIWMPFAKKIIIIGGDLVGLELAEFLIERGRQVTVLEPTSTLGSNLSIVRRSRVVYMLKEHGAILLTNVDIKEITKKEVIYSHADAEHHEASNQVIIAIGANPNLTLSESIKAAGISVNSVGDCTSAGYIHGAIADARNATINV
jgi:2,4-dienoyl-CoA reductase-like NADH-dependent reductase (Old Yellow Enzyme family)/NADPH-dependent 2,4-dienoyl-CoA reductase/sulfur reductase-like enzyme|tara:strand:- start:5839 stop:7965 length:2127 start_codon:yes stop_codon:yes gene_type:complete